MNVLIIGIDGYIGWSLALHLLDRGFSVFGIDNFKRRDYANSAIPIANMKNRLNAVKDNYNKRIEFFNIDVSNRVRYEELKQIFISIKPQTVIHLGEIPSAAYSMIDAWRATEVQINNIIGTLNILYCMKETCPDTHLVKLGTMGEYGTPNVDIPEGFFEIEYNNRKDRLPFPKQAGSWYHQSKVHDTNNIMMACRIWGLRSTDVMQGVVYGTNVLEVSDERLYTRLDFDECFGTVIHRFCCQAVIEYPLTVYGNGNQKRGFLPLSDALQCLTLSIENPPVKGEYRTLNQFDEVYSVLELAQRVKKICKNDGIDVLINNIKNPRVEKESHYYNPEHKLLFDLGYSPLKDLDGQIQSMLSALSGYTTKIEEEKECLFPKTSWKN